MYNFYLFPMFQNFLCANNIFQRKVITNCSSRISLGFDSEWFLGPAYVKLPVKDWPVNWDFADRKGAVKLPKEEIRKVCSADMGVVGPGSLDNPVLDPDLLRGGQAGQYPAPLDEGEGHDGYVGIHTGKVMYPVMSDNVRKRYVRD